MDRSGKDDSWEVCWNNEMCSHTNIDIEVGHCHFRRLTNKHGEYTLETESMRLIWPKRCL